MNLDTKRDIFSELMEGLQALKMHPLWEAAAIMDEAIKQCGYGEAKLILNNAIGHVLAQYYGNGYEIRSS